MMEAGRVSLRYKPFWLGIGLCLIAVIVQQTLTASPVNVDVKVSDKVLHTVGYFVLMGWFMQIYHAWRQKIFCAAGFIAMGVLLEFIQGWSGVRHYEVMDMVANGFGVIVGLALSYTAFSRILVFVESVIRG